MRGLEKGKIANDKRQGNPLIGIEKCPPGDEPRRAAKITG
jgi:hypothetical protein